MILDRLLCPISREEFSEKYWSIVPLKIFRDVTDYYKFLRVEQEIDQILFLASRFSGAVEVLSEQSRKAAVRRHSDPTRLLRKGKSIRINGVQNFSPDLSALSRELEQLLCFPVNINLYISPPSSPKALRRHFDTHDVFVLQISGKKHWNIYNSQTRLPLEFLPLLQHETVSDMKKSRLPLQPNQVGKGAQTDSFVLGPGDLLYMPRGTPHEAETTGEDVSCHLTVGVSPTSYVDLLTLAIARAADADIRLRQSLPLGFMTHPSSYERMNICFDRIANDLPQLLSGKQAASQLAGVFQRRRKRHLESRVLNPVNISDVQQLSLESWVHIRAGTVVSIDYGADPVQLLVGHRTFNLDSRFINACRFAIAERKFRPSMLPGDLTDEQKLEFVRLLTAASIVFPSDRSLDSSP